ncbi:MAG: hypothetical protein LLH30_06830 [Candidatus Manganitrophus sp. SA1]|nr:hypothetical protein [Candidatus Manganitrophus morganii]
MIILLLGFFIALSYQPKIAQAQWVDIDANLYTTTDNVGIGTASPSVRLQVETTAADIARFVRSGSSSSARMEIKNDTNSFWFGLDNLEHFKISPTQDIATDTTFVIQRDGNVGIGTTSPAAKLDIRHTYSTATGGQQFGQQLITEYAVADTSLKQGLRLNPRASQTTGTLTDLIGLFSLPEGRGNGGITTNATSLWSRVDTFSGHTITNAYNLNINDGTGTGTIGTQYGVYVGNLTKGSTDNFALYTAGTTKSYFGGNVGIGTTTPAAKLDVRNSYSTATGGKEYGQLFITYYGAADTAAKYGLFVSARASQPTGTLASLIGLASEPEGSGAGGTTTSATSLWSRVNTSTGHTITNAYNLNINDSSGTGTIGTQYGVYINTLTKGSTDNFALYANGATKSYFGGNVGIGTTLPSAKLHVRGPDGISAIGAPSAVYLQAGSGVNELNKIDFLNANGGSIGLIAGLVETAGSYPNSKGAVILGTQNLGSTNEVMRLTSSGNVGIGTTVPGELLHLKKEGNYQVRLHSSAAGGGFWNIGQTDNDFASGGGRLVFVPNSTSSNNASVTFMSSGNVGIGTTNPSTKLHVAGDITVTGNIAAKYQDVAEWVTSPKAMPAGTVVMLHPDQTNQVLPSMKAYDTRVAGVISEMPGILLGEAGEGKVKVATTGRVKVKVDATKGAVQVGDLLVTSDKEGVAMKSEPLDLGGVPIHRPGTLIGKALEPLSEGEGEILVLLSLQ